MDDRLPHVDPFEPVPSEWVGWLREMEQAGGSPNTREAARARLDVALLMTHLQHRIRMFEAESAAADARASMRDNAANMRARNERKDADLRLRRELKAAERRATDEREYAERRATDEAQRAEAAHTQAGRLTQATVVLAVATVVLAVATVVLVLVTVST